MKVILLAGGFGARLPEYTKTIPKPLVKIGNKPLIVHIMDIYARQGFSQFVIALGYKGDLLLKYFLKNKKLNNKKSNLKTGIQLTFKSKFKKIKITFVDTGIHSMTGGRLKRLQRFIGNKTCMLTYGDGVADIDLQLLLSFHRNHGKMITDYMNFLTKIMF